jgi:hypothetical protein
MFWMVLLSDTHIRVVLGRYLKPAILEAISSVDIPVLSTISAVTRPYVYSTTGSLKTQVAITKLDQVILSALRNKVKLLRSGGTFMDVNSIPRITRCISTVHTPFAFSSFFLPIIAVLPIQLQTNI